MIWHFEVCLVVYAAVLHCPLLYNVVLRLVQKLYLTLLWRIFVHSVTIGFTNCLNILSEKFNLHIQGRQRDELCGN